MLNLYWIKPVDFKCQSYREEDCHNNYFRTREIFKMKGKENNEKEMTPSLGEKNMDPKEKINHMKMDNVR